MLAGNILLILGPKILLKDGVKGAIMQKAPARDCLLPISDDKQTYV